MIRLWKDGLLLCALLRLAPILACTVLGFDTALAGQGGNAVLSTAKSVAQSTRAEGGVSGGGSTGVLVGDNLILLDLYLVNPQLNDLPSSQDNISYFAKRFMPKDLASYQLAIRLLNRWNTTSPGIVRTIHKALDNMQFEVDTLPKQKGYFIPPGINVPSDRLHSIAGYYADKNGAIISRKAWNQLGRLSKAGVLIHEALRHIQVIDTYGNSREYFEDKELQTLTAKIILGPMNSEDQIDSIQLGSFLKGQELFYDRASIQKNRNDLCQELENLIIQPNVSITVQTSYLNDVRPYCQNQISANDLRFIAQVTGFANSLTTLIPDFFASQSNEQNRKFISIRDKALVLSLKCITVLKDTDRFKSPARY